MVEISLQYIYPGILQTDEYIVECLLKDDIGSEAGAEIANNGSGSGTAK